MRYLIVLLMCGFSIHTSAQTLSGKVSGETEDGGVEPLIGATVYFLNTTTGAFTDNKGKYKLDIPSGAEKVVFSYIGFATDTIAISGQTKIDVTLKKGDVLDVAEVEAEESSTEMSLIDPLNVQLITEKELAKAACCNLSESFETNASIDASFTDAVTGTSQIRMLGLDGKYTQIMQDVVPSVRGLYVLNGLTYVPGPWIESIQVSKGVGSVSNGYESMTGQINVSMKNPENAEKLYINAYANQGGRSEFNAAYNIPVGKRFKTLISGHGELNDRRVDNNNDGFMDNPLKRDYILRNAWKYQSLNNGWRGEYQVTFLGQERLSGQLDFQGREDAFDQELWGAELSTQNLNAYVKNGYVWQEKPWRSFGSQVSYVWHDQQGNYGLRNYKGEQQSARVNLLYASEIFNCDNKFLTGVSYQYDEFRESLDSLSFDRVERVPGAFFEYTYTHADRFTLVAGVRGDHHNLFGWFLSPRLHARYSITENTSIKLASGKGYRTSNILMEHVGILASNRLISVNGVTAGNMPNLKPEVSWNNGINLLSKFRLNYREASISLDYYYTYFEDQVVMDLEDVRQARFYNLDGESFSHSAQVEFNWTPVRRWDLRTAYRWLDVQTQYIDGLLEKPFVNKHRAFANIAYETKANEKGGNWKFDLTGNWVGQGRLPNTSANPIEYEINTRTDDYVLLNAQVTRTFSKAFEVYLGAENLTNFQQPRAILAADQPFSENFDASLVWGPVFGRMIYTGLRWRIE